MSFSSFKPIYVLIVIILTLGFFYIKVSAAPDNFPKGQIISIEDGAGLVEVSNSLQRDNVIRSALLFRTIAIILRGEKSMQSGDYFLEDKQNVLLVARRVVGGDHGIEVAKITIPEGFTVKKISNLFDSRFKLFDHSYFESNAKEGFMFPDTYFVGVNASASSTMDLLSKNFNKKIITLSDDIDKFGKPLESVITMASILEGEARTLEDKMIVSGILWKRINKGIPLQVDTSFVYINGKTTKDLTMTDLKIDSPYNTYLYTGLPPTPISNPGLLSIQAAVNPTTTPYLYFLTDNEGKMHYARTFNEHIKNKQRYLNP